jgi:hypothetical protein
VARGAMRIDGSRTANGERLDSRADPTSEPAVGPGMTRAARDALAFVVRTLFVLDMPSDEISAIVDADQQMLVHRYLELHAERLRERLADQLQILARIEQILDRAILDRSQSIRLTRRD